MYHTPLCRAWSITYCKFFLPLTPKLKSYQTSKFPSHFLLKRKYSFSPIEEQCPPLLHLMRIKKRKEGRDAFPLPFPPILFLLL
ncbi:unnamed protein product [Meloidogyne enterolobii]|uniref:Uncharacterized protein n=1 Tax=Meloidogyne enterolobii TaxID=390850 RepID=A0ACB0YSY1_MELEN